MKSMRFIATNLLLLFAAGAFACGWWPKNSGEVLLYRIMPLEESDFEDYIIFGDYKLHSPKVDYRDENIALWQKETSRKVSKRDIGYVVYDVDIAYLQRIRKNLEHLPKQKNSFINWIAANKRADILDLLILAKQCENVRAAITDPWYYRVEDGYHYRALNDIVDKCRRYTSGPLLSRYALQMTRALCTLREYEQCAEYWAGIKGKLPHDVVRVMTELQAAAALNKTGYENEAMKIYAKYGDVTSIRAINGGKKDDEMELVYRNAPNSPYMPGELQKWLILFGSESKAQLYAKGEFDLDFDRWDLDRLNAVSRVAENAVKNVNVENKAMWYYTIAALYDIKGKPFKAKRYLETGEKYPKNPFLRDTYRVLHMWLDAKTSVFNEEYESRLMRDLKWLGRKIKREATPEIYRKLNYDYTALRSYDDDHRDPYQCYANSFYWNDAMRRLLLHVVCPKMHKAGKHIREMQLANMAENFLVKTAGYSGEMFLIVDRHSYKDAKRYFYRVYHPEDKFDRFLNAGSRTDKLYWYDILGTKCLRERRYEKSLVYLRQVPVEFQKKLAAYEYMHRPPFSYDMEAFKNNAQLAPNYKLHFAEAMVKYQRTMMHDRNPNRRAEAKIKYALGLRNSVHKCWPLTRYSSNVECNYIRDAVSEIPYPDDTAAYLHDEYLRLSNKLIQQAFRTFTDRELTAREMRSLLYYKRIVRDFADTQTAKDLILHCDRWRDYARKD